MVKLDDVQTLKQIAKPVKAVEFGHLESHWRIYSHLRKSERLNLRIPLHNWLKGFRSF